MGAFGFRIFENDDAFEWLNEFGHAENEVAFIHATLQDVQTTAHNHHYLEAPEASGALVAAEVVAALKGQPLPSLPDELRVWVLRQNTPPDSALIDLAFEVVRAVETNSELRELWSESGNEFFADWRRTLDDLELRLKRDTP